MRQQILRIKTGERNLGTCRSCGATIEWAELVSGARHPFNSPLHPVGGTDVTLEVDAAQSHFATCPDAKKWSKGKSK